MINYKSSPTFYNTAKLYLQTTVCWSIKTVIPELKSVHHLQHPGHFYCLTLNQLGCIIVRARVHSAVSYSVTTNTITPNFKKYDCQPCKTGDLKSPIPGHESVTPNLNTTVNLIILGAINPYSYHYTHVLHSYFIHLAWKLHNVSYLQHHSIKHKTLYQTIKVRLIGNSNTQESMPNTQHFHEGYWYSHLRYVHHGLLC